MSIHKVKYSSGTEMKNIVMKYDKLHRKFYMMYTIHLPHPYMYHMIKHINNEMEQMRSEKNIAIQQNSLQHKVKFNFNNETLTI